MKDLFIDTTLSLYNVLAKAVQDNKWDKDDRLDLTLRLQEVSNLVHEFETYAWSYMYGSKLKIVKTYISEPYKGFVTVAVVDGQHMLFSLHELGDRISVAQLRKKR